MAEGQTQHPLHVRSQHVSIVSLASLIKPTLNRICRFPGLGTAVAIFSVYLAGEQIYKKLSGSSSSHH